MNVDRFEIEIEYANQAQRVIVQEKVQSIMVELAAFIKETNQNNQIHIKQYHYEE